GDDGPSAVAACAALETQGISCWMAPRDIPPGARYPAAIAEAISGARVLVLIYSSSCNTSPHIERELERATSRGILVVPVRLDKAALSPSLEYLLSTPQWVDASEARLEMHLGRLVEAVKEQLVHVPLAKRPGPKAPRARRWRITAG